MKTLHTVILSGLVLAVGCATSPDKNLAKSMATPPSDKGPRLIQAGPMIGHVGPHEARVWIRTKLGSSLKASAVQGSKARNRYSVEDLGNGFSVIHYSLLAPATDTQVTLAVERSGSATETETVVFRTCLLYTSPSPRDRGCARMPSSA